MNLIQSKEDTVSCLTFYKATSSKELQTIIDQANYYSDGKCFQDTSSLGEHMYGLTVLEELTELGWIKPSTKAELILIRKLMDEQNASYFRFLA